MIKVIELFAGVGCQREALNRLDIEYEIVGISEIDKFAINVYEQLHGKTRNFGDISKIDKLPESDLWTYSFPCQDLSVIGLQKGIRKGTRSGLLLEVERLLEVSPKPKYLLMENVKNLLSKKNKPEFEKWCKKLEELGYTNYYKIINSKDYGVPQNRERVFMVSILGEHDIYNFPRTKRLKIKFKDVVRDRIPVKDKAIDSFLGKKEFFRKRFTTVNGDLYAMCLTTKNSEYLITNNFYTDDYAKYSLDEVSKNNIKCYIPSPRECWNLMGWDEERFNQIKGISNTQLCKLAGNGIVVDVLYYIFKKMFKKEIEDEEEN